jgi:hypothetical protein
MQARDSPERLSRTENVLIGYSLKRGVSGATKYFIFNSKDWFVRRVLGGWGWVENKARNSQFFNLKWAYTDAREDYPALAEGQHFNHFYRNHELTTKNALRRNLLAHAPESGLPPHSYFPCSFELSFASDLADFHLEAERLRVSILLRRALAQAQRHPLFGPVLERVLEKQPC